MTTELPIASAASGSPSSAPPRSRRAWVALLTAVALLASLVAAAPTDAASPAAAKPFRFDLYQKGDFVSQSNLYQCVGASMQMMLNLASPSANRTAARQLELQTLARSFRRQSDPNNMNSGPVRTPRGASSRGWAAGLTVSGLGVYRVTTQPTLEEAILVAAVQMRRTGRPVGLLVWRGAHAWVVSGFEATADPLYDPEAQITHVYILDPYYPRVSSAWGRSPAPHTRMSLDTLGADWVPWRRSVTRPGMTGRWAMILPLLENRPGERRTNLR